MKGPTREYIFSLQLQKCMELDQKLKEMDREVAVNPQYVQKVTGFL